MLEKGKTVQPDLAPKARPCNGSAVIMRCPRDRAAERNKDGI